MKRGLPLSRFFKSIGKGEITVHQKFLNEVILSNIVDKKFSLCVALDDMLPN